MRDDVNAAFAEDLPKFISGFEQREGQVQMAGLVADVFEDPDPHVALIDAGTGVGKSMAYLIPAALHHLATGGRVLVSTSSIALMDQLEGKELPMIERMFPGVTTAVLKGQGNYVCVRKLDGLRANEQSLRPALRDLLGWATTTDTGDRRELTSDPGDEMWGEVSLKPGTCRGNACRDVSDCHMMAARRHASRAAIVVTNHYLLMHGVRIALAGGGGNRMLRNFDALVVDEGHSLADVARSVLGFTLTRGNVAGLARMLDQASELRRRVENEADALFADLTRLVSDGATVRLVTPPQVRWQPLVEALASLESVYTDEMASASGERRADLANVIRRADDARMQIASACRVQNPSDVYFVEPRRIEGAVVSAALRSSVLDPADQMAAGLWEQIGSAVVCSATLATGGQSPFAFVRTELGVRTDSWVDVSRERGLWCDPGDVMATSAVDRFREVSGWVRAIGGIADAVSPDGDVRVVAGDPVRFVCVESTSSRDDAERRVAELVSGGGELLRQQRRVREITHMSVVSPFDYAGRFAVVVDLESCVGIRSHRFNDSVADQIHWLADRLNGRTLGLFTSRSALRYVADTLRTRIRQPLLVQGEMGRGELLRRFVQDETAVCLGTVSLGTGVDAMGATCAAVVIDRIPFASPADPVMAALKERRTDSFQREFMPRAVRTFRQWIGRGYRRSDDACVVYVMDERLLTKSYGREFTSALPPGVRVIRTTNEAREFQDRVLSMLVAQTPERAEESNNEDNTPIWAAYMDGDETVWHVVQPRPCPRIPRGVGGVDGPTPDAPAPWSNVCGSCKLDHIKYDDVPF